MRVRWGSKFYHFFQWNDQSNHTWRWWGSDEGQNSIIFQWNDQSNHVWWWWGSDEGQNSIIFSNGMINLIMYDWFFPTWFFFDSVLSLSIGYFFRKNCRWFVWILKMMRFSWNISGMLPPLWWRPGWEALRGTRVAWPFVFSCITLPCVSAVRTLRPASPTSTSETTTFKKSAANWSSRP